MVSEIKREDPSVRGLSYISTTTYTAQHGGSDFEKSSDTPPRDSVRPLAFFRVGIVQGSA